MKVICGVFLASFMMMNHSYADVTDYGSCLILHCEDTVVRAHEVWFEEKQLKLIDESGKVFAKIENKKCSIMPHNYCY